MKSFEIFCWKLLDWNVRTSYRSFCSFHFHREIFFSLSLFAVGRIRIKQNEIERTLNTYIWQCVNCVSARPFTCHFSKLDSIWDFINRNENQHTREDTFQLLESLIHHHIVSVSYRSVSAFSFQFFVYFALTKHFCH